MFKKYVCITLGTFLLALGVGSFLAPFDMVIGGAGGIGIIAERLFRVPLWVTSAAVNIPLLVMAVFQKGLKYTGDTIYSTALFSIFLAFTENIVFIEDDIFLACAFGGFITGSGLGLVIKADCSTGGSDLLASIIHQYVPHISISRIILFIDGIIIVGGMLILGAAPTMYAVITLYISTKAIDLVVEEVDFAKAAFIICSEPAPILNAVSKKIQRGATIINTRGSYTGRPNCIILTVVTKREISLLKSAVAQCEANAFVIVTDVREIVGDFNRRK